MENMIDITGTDLVKLAQHAYALSIPQGLGFLHARAGGLSQEDAQQIVNRERADSHVALGMDYVHGRAVKLTVRRERETGELFISRRWYDHTPDDLRELLKAIGKPEKVEEVA